MPTLSSNHCALFISITVTSFGQKIGRKISRYEASWATFDDCGKLVHRLWSHNTLTKREPGSMCKKLK